MWQSTGNKQKAAEAKASAAFCEGGRSSSSVQNEIKVEPPNREGQMKNFQAGSIFKQGGMGWILKR